MKEIWLVVRTLAEEDRGIVTAYEDTEQAALHAGLANDAVRRALQKESRFTFCNIPYDHDPMWVDVLWRYEVERVQCMGGLGEYLERRDDGG